MGEDDGDAAAAVAEGAGAESKEEMETRHKKELKSFEGSKRAGLKKAKATAGKGKKGKEAMAALEKEYESKERDMKERHSHELLSAATSSPPPAADTTTTTGIDTPSSTTPVLADPSQKQSGGGDDDGEENDNDNDDNPAAQARKKKLAKALRKKEREREKERLREMEIAEELANAGPLPRDVEISAMKELYLNEKGLEIREVEADGHCLYRAVAVQCRSDGDIGGAGGDDYRQIRSMCAERLEACEDEYSPFAEYDDTFSHYVERVRSSAEWGGQLELRALASALRRPIVVYSAEAPPLTMEPDGAADGGDDDAILLSFHRHYYALGEHYNCVVPRRTSHEER